MSAILQDDRLAIDADGVLKRIPISRRTLESLVQRKEIPHFRLGRRVLFPTGELQAWIQARTEGPVSTDVHTVDQ